METSFCQYALHEAVQRPTTLRLSWVTRLYCSQQSHSFTFVWPNISPFANIILNHHFIFTVDLVGKEGNFSMLQFEDQRTWIAMYAPAEMCNVDVSTTQPVFLGFHIQLFNTDSHGIPANQFSCEDTGESSQTIRFNDLCYLKQKPIRGS